MCAGSLYEAGEWCTMKTVGQRSNRSRSLRGGSNTEQSGDSTVHSTVSAFRLISHFCFCFASLILGFCLSRESLLVVVSLKSSDAFLYPGSYLPSRRSESSAVLFSNGKKSLFQDPLLPELKPNDLYHEDDFRRSRVHVGRHDILIRQWPHADPAETVMAQNLIARVQKEQRKLYGLTERRPVIVITPTHRRTCQALHLSSLMHTLMLVAGPLSWIVVEAGGGSAETASILSKSVLNYYHLYLSDPMPAHWHKRHQMDTLLRIRGLRFVRENELEGLVVFADEGNSHRLELFDEVQKLHWVGALSVGLLNPPQASDDGNKLLRWNSLNVADPSVGFLPVQGPACNTSGHLIGWHSESGSVPVVSGTSKMWPKLEWAGFVLNSAAIVDGFKKPNWIRDFDEWVLTDGRPVNPTSIVTDETFIEPLGNCGREILLWRAVVEARVDSKYPEGWVTDQQLEIVVPAKHTPWPDPPPPSGQSYDLPVELRVDVEEVSPLKMKLQGQQSPKRRTKNIPSKEQY